MKTLPLTKKMIDALFDTEGIVRHDILYGLYKMAFPDWDKIKSVDGFPAISKPTNLYIMGQFIKWDQKHSDCFAGGLWMNNGFFSTDSMEDWKVKPCEVTYKT